MPGPEKRVLDLNGAERVAWLAEIGKKAKAGVDRGLMLAGQARPEEEANGVAATVSRPATTKVRRLKQPQGRRLAPKKGPGGYIQRTNRHQTP